MAQKYRDSDMLIELLKRLRYDKGWTQKQMAEKLGISQHYMCRILGGYYKHHMTPTTAQRFEFFLKDHRK